jgi:hypothetical protein
MPEFRRTGPSPHYELTIRAVTIMLSDINLNLYPSCFHDCFRSAGEKLLV